MKYPDEREERMIDRYPRDNIELGVCEMMHFQASAQHCDVSSNLTDKDMAV